ncbi:MAG: hypothetical protein K0R24_183 [Gammaproteobacteria bacterium]|jgi:WD40 repeat protein|nr:hypothetical protein [Gammaproteobacteria bacterium]
MKLSVLNYLHGVLSSINQLFSEIAYGDNPESLQALMDTIESVNFSETNSDGLNLIELAHLHRRYYSLIILLESARKTTILGSSSQIDAFCRNLFMDSTDRFSLIRIYLHLYAFDTESIVESRNIFTKDTWEIAENIQKHVFNIQRVYKEGANFNVYMKLSKLYLEDINAENLPVFRAYYAVRVFQLLCFAFLHTLTSAEKEEVIDIMEEISKIKGDENHSLLQFLSKSPFFRPKLETFLESVEYRFFAGRAEEKHKALKEDLLATYKFLALLYKFTDQRDKELVFSNKVIEILKRMSVQLQTLSEQEATFKKEEQIVYADAEKEWLLSKTMELSVVDELEYALTSLTEKPSGMPIKMPKEGLYIRHSRFSETEAKNTNTIYKKNFYLNLFNAIAQKKPLANDTREELLECLKSKEFTTLNLARVDLQKYWNAYVSTPMPNDFEQIFQELVLSLLSSNMVVKKIFLGEHKKISRSLAYMIVHVFKDIQLKNLEINKINFVSVSEQFLNNIVNLNSFRLTETEVIIILAFIKQTPNISKINLSNNFLKDKGISDLLTGIKKLGLRCTIDLRNTGLTKDGIQDILRYRSDFRLIIDCMLDNGNGPVSASEEKEFDIRKDQENNSTISWEILALRLSHISGNTTFSYLQNDVTKSPTYMSSFINTGGNTAIIRLQDGRIVTGTTSGEIHLHDKQMNLLSSWMGHKKGVSVLTELNTAYFISSSGRTLVVWNLLLNPNSFTKCHHEQACEGIIRACIKLMDGRIAIAEDSVGIKVGCLTYNGNILEKTFIRCANTLIDGGIKIHTILQLSNGYIVGGLQNGLVVFWNPDTGEQVASCSLTQQGKRCNIYAFAELEGRYLAVGTQSGKIFLLNLERNYQQMPETGEHKGPIYALIELYDGSLASGATDGIVKIWGVQLGRLYLRWMLKSQQSPINGLTQLQDGKIVGIYKNGLILVWNYPSISKLEEIDFRQEFRYRAEIGENFVTPKIFLERISHTPFNRVESFIKNIVAICDIKHTAKYQYQRNKEDGTLMITPPTQDGFIGLLQLLEGLFKNQQHTSIGIESKAFLNDLLMIVKTKLLWHYKDNSFIERVSDKCKIHIYQQFVNLAIVQESEMREKESRLENKKTKVAINCLPSSFEELRQPKEPINLADLYGQNTLYKPNGQVQTQHLLLGSAGMGKTTSCQHILAQWAKGELWNTQFNWIFWIPLRLFRRYTDGDKPKLWEALYEISWKALGLAREDSEFFWKLLQKEVAENKVLWLLDGYDEIDNVSIDEAIQPLLDELLKMPYHILTSRPYGISKLAYISRLELIGFTENAITKYINQYFDDSIDAAAMLSLLKKDIRLRSLMSIPANADLICGLYQSKASKGAIALSKLGITEIYDILVDELLLRSKRKKEEQSEEEPEFSKTIKIDVELVGFLEQLAWDNLGNVENSIIITKKQQKQALLKTKEYQDIQLLDRAFNSGLLKNIGALDNENYPDHDLAYSVDCYFIHLTFRDFFAAKHVVSRLTSLNKEDKKLIKNEIIQKKYNPYYYYVWAFTAGLLKKESRVLINEFFEFFIGKPRDICGIYEAVLLMQCYEEADLGKDLNIQTKQRITNSIKEWIETSLSNYQISNYLLPQVCSMPHIMERIVFPYFFDNFQKYTTPSVCRYFGWPLNPEQLSILFDYLIKFLNTDKAKLSTIDTLAHLGWPSSPDYASKTFGYLFELLDHSNDKIKSVALEAFGRLGWPSNPDQVSTLLKKLMILNEKAVDTLRHLGWPSNQDQISICVKQLVAQLDIDNYYYVKRDTFFILMGLGWPSDPNQASMFVKQLANLLDKDNDDIKINVLSIFECLGWPSNIEQTFECIKTFLRSSNERVRVAARDAFKHLSWPLNADQASELFCYLMRLCNDKEYAYAKRSAIYALGYLGWPSDPEQASTLFNHLTTLLKGDSISKFDALCTIKHLGKPSNAEYASILFEQLISLLHNVAFEYNVLEALGNFGWPSNVEQASTLVNCLATLLSNSDVNVKGHTLSTLGQLGWPSDVAQASMLVKCLANLLENRNAYFFENAVHKLSTSSFKILFSHSDFLENSAYCKIIRDKAISSNVAIYFQKNERGEHAICFYENNQSQISVIISKKATEILLEVFAETNPLLAKSLSNLKSTDSDNLTIAQVPQPIQNLAIRQGANRNDMFFHKQKSEHAECREEKRCHRDETHKEKNDNADAANIPRNISNLSLFSQRQPIGVSGELLVASLSSTISSQSNSSNSANICTLQEWERNARRAEKEEGSSSPSFSL